MPVNSLWEIWFMVLNSIGIYALRAKEKLNSGFSVEVLV